ncbi:MAG: FkbM family methyltransferase [Bacteroidota bacterium]
MVKNESSIINKFFHHLRHGSLLHVYKTRKNTKRAEKRLRKWDGLSLGCEVIHKISPKTFMILNKGSELDKFIYLRSFENDEQIFVNRYIKQGDTFIDIGANTGLFALQAARLTQENVYAFEPVETTCLKLKKNIQFNKINNIIVEQIALSDKEGYAEMHISDSGYDAWNSLAGPLAEGPTVIKKIKTTTLDTYVKAAGISKVALIKIDVEGWETHVLKGGTHFFQSGNADVMLIEFTEKNLNMAGVNSETLYNAVQNCGFSLYTYDSKNNTLIPEKPGQVYVYANLIAVRNFSEALNRIRS